MVRKHRSLTYRPESESSWSDANEPNARTLNICDVVFPASGGLVREKTLLQNLRELGHRVFVAEVMGKTSISATKITLLDSTNNSHSNIGTPSRSHRDGLSHFRSLPPPQQRTILNQVLKASEHPDELQRLSNFLNRNRVDVVISGDFTITSPILSAVKEFSPIPMVTLSAGHEIAYETFERLGFKKAWLDVLYSEALARLDLVITPSKFEAHRTAKQFGLKGNRLRVIYNGIDVRRARRMASNASPTRSFLSKLGLKKKGYVLYVGRLDSDKGIHILPFLACTIAEPILVAGEHMYDSPYGEVIFKKIISYYDLGGRLIPIGYVSENSKFALMANALATVYPSTNAESFGLVPIESVAVGTPALLPGLGPFPEIAKKIGDMCQLYRPFDVSLLAKALSRVRGQDLTQAKEKAVVAIQENFDSRRMAERVASTMRNLV